MKILDIYSKKIEEENKGFLLKPVGQSKLPKDIRRSPGGNFEKQPDFNYPDMKVQPFTSDVGNQDQVSDVVKTMFSTGANDFNEAIQRLTFITERLEGLDKSLHEQYPNEFDTLPLRVSLNSSIKSLEEIKKYFDDGASGTLNLKMAQKDPPQAYISMAKYFNDGMDVLNKLYKDIQMLYNATANKLDATKNDVRTLLWEATYAFQVIRDSHDAMGRQYEQSFGHSVSEIEKPEAPKLKDDLELEVKPPKEIANPDVNIAPTPEAKNETPTVETPSIIPQIAPTPLPPNSIDSPVGEIPDSSETPDFKPVKEPEKINIPTPVKDETIKPPKSTNTPKKSPEEELEDKFPWKGIRESKDEFISIYNNMHDKVKKTYSKWVVDHKAPNATMFPIGGDKFIEIEKDGENVIKFRIVDQDYIEEINNTFFGKK